MSAPSKEEKSEQLSSVILKSYAKSPKTSSQRAAPKIWQQLYIYEAVGALTYQEVHC